jgi:hypothetical protein
MMAWKIGHNVKLSGAEWVAGSSHMDPNIWQLKLSGLTNNLQMYTVGEEKFSLGSVVYINRHSPAPPAPSPGSSEATILEYDRAYLWVAKVLEVRAKDDQHVYLRLFWLYWPDEVGDNHIMAQMSFYTENQFQNFLIGALEGLIFFNQLFSAPGGVRQVILRKQTPYSSSKKNVTS